MRVLIATPNYGGTLCTDMADARQRECFDLASNGIAVALDTSQRSCWLTRARGLCARAALQREATHLLFWDADVVPLKDGYVRRLLDTEHDVVAGVYPTRAIGGPLAFQVKAGQAGESADAMRVERGCVEVDRVGTGFMLIATEAFERLKPHVRHYVSAEGLEEWGWFDYGTRGDAPEAEDFAFCDRVRKAGMRIFVEPTMHFAHVGSHAFTGHMQRMA